MDASLAGAWILPDEDSRRAERILSRLLSSDDELCVPHLWLYEVTNLLLSAERRKRITSAQLREAHELIDRVPRTTFDHESILARERIGNFARRFRLSAYDAAYVELADRLQCHLATLDERLAKASDAIAR